MAEDQEQTRLLQQMLDALQRTGGDTDSPEVKKAKKALTDYNLQVTRSTRQEKDRQQVLGTSIRMTKEAVVGTTKFIAAASAAASAIRENREDFNSLNPAINMAGDALSLASKTAGALADSLGDALKGIPAIGGIVGGVVSAGGKITAGAGAGRRPGDAGTAAGAALPAFRRG